MCTARRVLALTAFTFVWMGCSSAPSPQGEASALPADVVLRALDTDTGSANPDDVTEAAEPDVGGASWDVEVPVRADSADTAASPPTLEVWLEPNVTNPLAVWVHVSLGAPAVVRVTAWRGEAVDWQVDTAEASDTHRVAVLGLRPGASYDVVVDTMTEAPASLALSHEAGTLASTLPPITTSVIQPESVAPGVTAFGLQGREEPIDPTWPLYLAVNQAGIPVWSYQDDAVDHEGVARDIRPTADGNFALLLRSGVRIITPAGETVHEWLEGAALGDGYHHDALVLPSGNLLALGREVQSLNIPSLDGVFDIRGDTVRELDPSGVELWSWSAFGHLDPNVLPGPLAQSLNQQGNYIDWTHGNGLALDEESDSVWVSLRHQNQVVQIDRATGAVLGRFGPGGDYALTEGSWFYSQHSPELDSAGGMLLYDNGNERADGVGGEILPKPQRYSRAVHYSLAPDSLTAEEAWSYQVPEFTAFLGGVARLANGNVLVCAGGLRGASSSGLARIHEVTGEASATLVWSLEVEGLVYRARRLTGLSQ